MEETGGPAAGLELLLDFTNHYSLREYTDTPTLCVHVGPSYSYIKTNAILKRGPLYIGYNGYMSELDIRVFVHKKVK